MSAIEVVRLFSDDFDEDAFFSFAVEFAVEDLLPGAEVESAVGYGDDDFAAHNGAFEVRIGVVFGGVVAILRVWFFGGEFLQPGLKILMQAGSSSLMNTLAVMCIALTRHKPFFDA